MAIAESILFQINSSNYTAPIFTIYKPQAEHSGFATTLRLTINIKSIDAAEFPYIPDDTPPDVLQQILEEVALNTPFKEIILYVKKGAGAWIERAPIRIFNKEPYYDVNLMRFFSDSNTIDIAEDLSLGIQIKIGNVLTPADSILVWGTVVAEKKNNGNEELANRISALETLLSVYGAPSANLPGSNGLVPAPPAGGGEFLLRGDRGWENPSKFVDLTTNQTIAGNKTLSGIITLSNATASTSRTTGAFIVLGGIGADHIKVKNAWLLEPRTGSVAIDANNLSYAQYAMTLWVDGSVTNSNLPINAGMLMQFDALHGLASANLYKVQEFTDGNGNFWKRCQNNGTWGAWRQIAFV
ncbi:MULTISPECIES: pyocin knob domain-containing protein [unclassified Microcoleus]|uniref:pyocin knob domain-containing protein n=1 Tax=unclassified Microcoleus TaxID=2642155 RepID=UPI002FD496EB